MDRLLVETAFEALSARLGSRVVVKGTDVPTRHANDWSALPPLLPAILVRPETTAEVAATLAICSELGMPVVPQGGLTGLAGGARALEGSVALSLERMNGVLEIDAASATMTVLAGTPLQTVQGAAEAAGFYVGLDLGARGSCAIGGNVSTNAGGNRVIRYGMARDMVLGMEVVLPDGTVVTNLNKMLKNNAGYDLRQLFVGAEGTLGVVTKLVLRLFPAPGSVHAALCGLHDYASVLALLASARRRLGPTLSAFEVMWRDYWQVATREVAKVRDPLRGDHAFYVLVEAQGTEESVDAPRFEGWLEQAFENGIVADGALARSLADVQAFWSTRDAAADFKQVLGPHLAYDIGLPVKDMDAYATSCRAALEAALPGCRALFYGHIGDGNMHIVAGVPGAASQPASRMDETIYGLVRNFGGTVSAEHGIGLTKKPYLAHSRSPEELELMRRIKRAIDPANILNPTKIFDLDRVDP